MKRHAASNINTAAQYDAIYSGPRLAQLSSLYNTANLVASIFKDGTVLDIGCGVGNYFPYYNNCKIVGVELSPFAAAKAKEAYPNADVRCVDIRQGDSSLLPFGDGEFDFVFAGEILEHMEKPWDLAIEIHRIVKPGGVVVATTPYEAEIPCEEHLWEIGWRDMERLFGPFPVKSVLRFCADVVERWEHLLVVAKKT